jgi:hypothetical protein
MKIAYKFLLNISTCVSLYAVLVAIRVERVERQHASSRWREIVRVVLIQRQCGRRRAQYRVYFVCKRTNRHYDSREQNHMLGIGTYF